MLMMDSWISNPASFLQVCSNVCLFHLDFILHTRCYSSRTHKSIKLRLRCPEEERRERFIPVDFFFSQQNIRKILGRCVNNMY